jgi:hypothetical protein
VPWRPLTSLATLLPCTAAAAACAAFQPRFTVNVTNAGNAVARRCRFVLGMSHTAAGEQLSPQPSVTSVDAFDLSCTTVRASSGAEQRFSLRDVMAATAAPSDVLDLAPGDVITCETNANTWPTLQYLPPGNLTLLVKGQMDSAGDVLITHSDALWITVPSVPQLLLHVDASKCRQVVTAGGRCSA